MLSKRTTMQTLRREKKKREKKKDDNIGGASPWGTRGKMGWDERATGGRGGRNEGRSNITIERVPMEINRGNNSESRTVSIITETVKDVVPYDYQRMKDTMKEELIEEVKQMIKDSNGEMEKKK